MAINMFNNAVFLLGPKGLVINYGEGGGGSTKWANRGSETLVLPPTPLKTG